MKISMTAKEIMDSGYWEEFCDLTGTNVWAINEGQVKGDQLLDLPDEIASKVTKGA